MLTDEVKALVAESGHDAATEIINLLLSRGAAPTIKHCLSAHAAQTDDSAPVPLAFLAVGAFLASVGDPPAMLVEGLIPANALVLLTGKPKMGKSLMALDIAEGVAGNKPIWGTRAVTKPGAVIYIGMEDGEYEIANRLLARGLRKDTENLPLYICAERVKLGDPESVRKLESVITPLNPVLIIIDTAREALGIRDYNDAAELAERLRPLRELARKLCSILLVSHNRKAVGDTAVDEIAGSNAFTSSVDGWISARSKTDDGDTRRLNLDIDGRGGMRGSVVVECELKGGFRFSEVGAERLSQERQMEAQEAASKRESDRLQPVIAFLRGKGKATVSEIATGANLNEETARRLVKAAVLSGVVVDTGEKSAKSGAGRPSPVYALNDTNNYPISLQSPIEKSGKLDNYSPDSLTPDEDADYDEEGDI